MCDVSGALFDKTQNYDVPFFVSFVVGVVASALHFLLVCLEAFKNRKRKQSISNYSRTNKCSTQNGDCSEGSNGVLVNGYFVRKPDRTRTVTV